MTQGVPGEHIRPKSAERSAQQRGVKKNVGKLKVMQKGRDGEEESEEEEEEGKYSSSSTDPEASEFDRLIKEASEERRRQGLSQDVAAEEETLGNEVQCVPCESEEGRKAKGVTGPVMVTKEERDEHNRTHIPFRSWCSYCVKGRSCKCHIEERQKRRKKRQREERRG